MRLLNLAFILCVVACTAARTDANQQAQSNDGLLHIGWAQVDITPQKPVALAEDHDDERDGRGRKAPSERGVELRIVNAAWTLCPCTRAGESSEGGRRLPLERPSPDASVPARGRPRRPRTQRVGSWSLAGPSLRIMARGSHR